MAKILFERLHLGIRKLSDKDIDDLIIFSNKKVYCGKIFVRIKLLFQLKGFITERQIQNILENYVKKHNIGIENASLKNLLNIYNIAIKNLIVPEPKEPVKEKEIEEIKDKNQSEKILEDFILNKFDIDPQQYPLKGILTLYKHCGENENKLFIREVPFNNIENRDQLNQLIRHNVKNHPFLQNVKAAEREREALNGLLIFQDTQGKINIQKTATVDLPLERIQTQNQEELRMLLAEMNDHIPLDVIKERGFRYPFDANQLLDEPNQLLDELIYMWMNRHHGPPGCN